MKIEIIFEAILGSLRVFGSRYFCQISLEPSILHNIREMYRILQPKQLLEESSGDATARECQQQGNSGI